MTRNLRIGAITAGLVASALATALGAGTIMSRDSRDGSGVSSMVPSRWKCGDPPQQSGASPIYYLTATGPSPSAMGRRSLSAGGRRIRAAGVRPVGRSHADRGEAIVWYGQGGSMTQSQRGNLAADGIQPLPVYGVSANPALCSTYWGGNLSDRPADQPPLVAAKAGLVSAGLASPEQMDDTDTLYMLSDDPLDSSQVILTADVPVASSSCPSPVPYGGACNGWHSLVAFVRLSDDAVTGVASGPSSG